MSALTAQDMLETLVELIEEDQITNEWDLTFFESITEQHEADRKLSEKQFECLFRIYNKYCGKD